MGANGFKELSLSSPDIVLASHLNFYGNRLVTGSADHRIRVFDMNNSEDWVLVDAWRGHNGEVLDVKWNHVALGSILASIGEDLKLKIWREETSQAPLSGRRFKNIFTQSSAHQVIYTSLDFKTIQRETFLAVITRDGLLSLLEPTKADRYDDWKEIDQFWACGQRIARGMETSFKVVFQQAERPNYNAVAAGVDPNALSVAIAAMDAVKIYRVLKPEDGAYRFESPVAELTSTEGLIRDVAWSPEVWRVHDLIATASCDGFVRIYKVFTHQTRPELRSVSLNKGIQPSSNAHTNQRGTPSGIGAGLAGTSRTASGGRVDSSFGQVPHDCELIEELRHDGVWRVEWLRGGNMLVSTGDTGKVHLWRQGLNGIWTEFADFGPENP